jgi:hypothetical protein
VFNFDEDDDELFPLQNTTYLRHHDAPMLAWGGVYKPHPAFLFLFFIVVTTGRGATILLRQSTYDGYINRRAHTSLLALNALPRLLCILSPPVSTGALLLVLVPMLTLMLTP